MSGKKVMWLFIGLILISSFFCLFLGLSNSSENLLLVSVFMIWVCIVVSSFKREKFSILAFLITFFTFLLGRLLVRAFDPTTSLSYSKHETIIHVLISLYEALAFFYLGTLIAGKIKIKISRSNNYSHRDIRNKNIDDANNLRIRIASKRLYLITCIFPIVINLEKIIYVFFIGGYTSYFVSFHSAFPYFFNIIADVNNYLFYFFLATLPNPREHNNIFIIRLFIGLTGMLYGQRNQVVMAVILVWIYIVLYENLTNTPYGIIKKRFYILTILLVPFILMFFEFFMAYRSNEAYSFINIGQSIKHMLSSLGGSVNVIGYGYELQESFPAGKLYSFGGVIDFFTQNVLVRSLLGTKVYQQNTIDMALHGNSYAQTITYLGWGRAVYLSGRGMGSSYIAEAYQDFGHFGISFFSAIFGMLLTKVNHLYRGRWIYNTIILISLYQILYSPRDSAGGFISAFFATSFIGTLLLVIVTSKMVKKDSTMSYSESMLK